MLKEKTVTVLSLQTANCEEAKSAIISIVPFALNSELLITVNGFKVTFVSLLAEAI